MDELGGWLRVHHVQLAMPPRGEDEARAFYAGVLGLRERPKPPALASRGGVWFRAGAVELHLGVEQGFAPARKAHPGLEVADLDGVVARLQAAGVDVRPDEDLPRYRRVYVDDPFGNRLELLQSTVAAAAADGFELRSFVGRGPDWLEPFSGRIPWLIRAHPESRVGRWFLRRRS